MSKVKYISSPNEIPTGQKHILVGYGEEYAETRHPLGLTITVASTVSQLSFLTAIHTAKGIAKQAGISDFPARAPCSLIPSSAATAFTGSSPHRPAAPTPAMFWSRLPMCCMPLCCTPLPVKISKRWQRYPTAS